MNLEWIDPPRDYRDDAADIAQQLRQRPGIWAKVLTASPAHEDYARIFRRLAIEFRAHNVQQEESHDYRSGQHLVWTTADLYARAPKEA